VTVTTPDDGTLPRREPDARPATGPSESASARQPAATGRVRVLVCSEKYCANQHIDRSSVVLVLPDGLELLWIDLEAPSAEVLQAVATDFDFHPLAVEDASQEHQRAKIDQYDSSYFLVLFGVTYNELTHQIEEHEVDFFVGPNFLFTVHQWPIRDMERVASRLQADLRKLDHGVGALLYSVADTIVDAYLPVAEQIRERIQELERRVFANELPRLRRGLHEDIFALRAELLELRYVIGPERDVLATLSRRGLRIVDKESALYFRDVADHLQRVVETIDVYHQMLVSVLDSYNAQSGNSLNEVMRVLTSCSIILMSVTLIAGVYGMNFNTSISPFNMPELNFYFGYPFALALMLTLTIALVLYFKRRGWL
jgi:magnesium transporter